MAITKLLLAETPANDPVREDIATIMRASERARDLVKQILAFSRKQDLIRQEVDLAALVREALQMLRAGLPATIRIVEQIDDVPAFFADAGELHQVFVNLVTNAAQAIGSEIGVITIGLARVEDGVALAVRDTGCGMDTATAERVFEPFFTTKGVGEGTGLGLSVVHGIVSNHGGRIQVASCAGEGTTFTVFFPTAETTATELEPIAA
jgi:two-component system cell cycle sensor histidine kinase/response regulator CckA